MDDSDDDASGSDVDDGTVKLTMVYSQDTSQVVEVEISRHTKFREALEEFIVQVGFRSGVEEFWMNWEDGDEGGEVDEDETPYEVGMGAGEHTIWVDYNEEDG